MRAMRDRTIGNVAMRIAIPDLKLCIFVIAALLFTGCASMTSAARCELEPAQFELLKARVLTLLDTEIQPSGAACEELSESTTYVRGRGCAIYGMAAGSDRPGCPDVLDGDYFVIFDPDTLQPTKLIWIAW